MNSLWDGLLFLVCCLCAIEVAAAERLPIPEKAAQKSALATVKDVSRQDLAAAKTASLQSDLAKRMLVSPAAIGAVALSRGATVSSTIWHRTTK